MGYATDDGLLASLLRGEEGAGDRFAERFGPVIRSSVRAALERHSSPSAHSVEDLIQETFLSLWEDDYRRLRAYDSAKASLATYLSVIAYRRTLDFLRQSRRRAGAAGLLENVPAPETAQERTRSSEIREAADSLPPRERAVFLLRFEQGLSYRQIAELTGLTTGAVGAFIARTKRRLRNRNP